MWQFVATRAWPGSPDGTPRHTAEDRIHPLISNATCSHIGYERAHRRSSKGTRPGGSAHFAVGGAEGSPLMMGDRDGGRVGRRCQASRLRTGDAVTIGP